MLSMTFARPKSATLTIGGSSAVKSTFSGLRSRWQMPIEWTYESASHIWYVRY